MKAYKGFDRNQDGKLSCRGFVYEIGRWYTHDGPIKACRSGFHACPQMKDVAQYYPVRKNWHEVEVEGHLVSEGDKIAAEKIRVIRKLTPLEKYNCNGYGDGDGDGDNIGRGNGRGYGYVYVVDHGFGDGGGYGRGDGCGYGNGHGYGIGNGYGNGHGYGYGRRYGYGRGYGYGRSNGNSYNYGDGDGRDQLFAVLKA